MKTNQIKRAALAAAILAGAGVAHGVESALQVVYCKATIMDNGGEDIVSVTIPPTDGYFDKDGNPLTYWNVGNVPAGGVADSWHGEGGPGRFTAHNEGNVGAYLYVTTGYDYDTFTTNEYGLTEGHLFMEPWDSVSPSVFGNNSMPLWKAVTSPSEVRNFGDCYHLAFTTDVTAKVPTWHSLDRRLYYYSRSPYYYWYWSTKDESDANSSSYDQIAGFMGYVDAGDYLTFDLKFWAPRNYPAGNVVLFTFCVEASAFPLWDHGRGIE